MAVLFVNQYQKVIWLNRIPSLQAQNAKNAANILKQKSIRKRGQPQKEELPQKDKQISASGNAALSLMRI